MYIRYFLFLLESIFELFEISEILVLTETNENKYWDYYIVQDLNNFLCFFMDC